MLVILLGISLNYAFYDFSVDIYGISCFIIVNLLTSKFNSSSFLILSSTTFLGNYGYLLNIHAFYLSFETINIHEP